MIPPNSCFRAGKVLAAFLALSFSVLLGGCSENPALPDDGSEGLSYYTVTARIRGFDPVKAGDVASSLAISKIYEGLLQYSYLERPYKVEPLLAESMPEVSEDGLTYTFRVRKGIFFADDPCFPGGQGRELRADDFVYAIKRIADLKNQSSGYWAFNGRIEGLDEFREQSREEGPVNYDREVSGLRALDDYTLQVRLTAPYPQLLWILAMHYAFAVPREAVEFYRASEGRPEFGNHPVGTGPYVLHAWKRNYRVEFRRNPKWAETGRVETYPAAGEPSDEAEGLLADAGKPIPFIDRIVQNVIDDESTTWLMFLSGQLSTSGISQDNWDQVVTDARELSGELAERGVKLIARPRMVIDYIGFNMDDPVVGQSQDPEADRRNRALRQALTCAFDTEKWLQFNNNRVTRPSGPIPPGVAGYSDRPSSFAFDLDRARALLAEAGYPGGQDPATGRRLELTLELRSATDPEVRQRADLVASFFEKIGVRMKPSYNNWPTFLEKMDNRQAQLFWLGWVADYPDAENFLQLFYGPNSSPGPNHANYVNAGFDQLYDRIRTMQDSPERTRIYEEMSDIVVQDCPWIFTSLPVSYALVHSWVANFKPHDFPYGMVKYQTIDTAVRSDWKQRYGEHR